MIFIDVDKNSWSKGHIDFVVENNYMEGYPDKTFRPKNYVTREQLAAVIEKLSKGEIK